MDNTSQENKDKQNDEKIPVDKNWLAGWLQGIHKAQTEQTKLLISIRNMIQFFVVLAIILLVLLGCNILFSFANL